MTAIGVLRPGGRAARPAERRRAPARRPGARARPAAAAAGARRADRPPRSAHQAECVALLRRFNRERGTTVLLVSHDLSLAAEVCDRLLLMQAGPAVRVGPPEAVLEEGLLAPCTAARSRGQAPGQRAPRRARRLARRRRGGEPPATCSTRRPRRKGSRCAPQGRGRHGPATVSGERPDPRRATVRDDADGKAGAARRSTSQETWPGLAPNPFAEKERCHMLVVRLLCRSCLSRRRDAHGAGAARPWTRWWSRRPRWDARKPARRAVSGGARRRLAEVPVPDVEEPADACRASTSGARAASARPRASASAAPTPTGPGPRRRRPGQEPHDGPGRPLRLLTRPDRPDRGDPGAAVHALRRRRDRRRGQHHHEEGQGPVLARRSRAGGNYGTFTGRGWFGGTYSFLDYSGRLPPPSERTVQERQPDTERRQPPLGITLPWDSSAVVHPPLGQERHRAAGEVRFLGAVLPNEPVIDSERAARRARPW